MFVIARRFSLFVPAAGSLKDRRRVVSGLKERIRGRFKVAVAEVDAGEAWQRAAIGVAVVSGSRGEAERLIEAVSRFVEQGGDFEVVAVDGDELAVG